jgi:hypothetical protein
MITSSPSFTCFKRELNFARASFTPISIYPSIFQASFEVYTISGEKSTWFSSKRGMGTLLTSLSRYGKGGKTFPEIGHATAGQEMGSGGKERIDIQE